jgi:hypothetical protein
MKVCVCGKNWATVGGKAMIAAAKMIGITPAMFTRSGMYVEPPEVMRRPTMRFAYWMGMRRCPSCTNTTATMMASAMSGNIRRSNASPDHQARRPPGRPARIEAKISSEMPLPMPRFVMSSPIHMRSVVAAVSDVTMSTKRPGVRVSASWRLNRYE